MFVKNEIGEFVNLDKVVAMRVFKQGANAIPDISLHAPRRVLFKFEAQDAYEYAEHRIRNSLYGAYHTWVQAGEYMFRADKIKTVQIEGWIVEVHMDDRRFEILTHSDDELQHVQDAFERAFVEEQLIVPLDK